MGGNINIKAQHLIADAPLFSFQFHVNKLHSYIDNIKSYGDRPSQFRIIRHSKNLDAETTQDSLNLLLLNNTRYVKQPLYKLFSRSMEDNDSRIEFMKELNSHYEPSSKGIFTKKNVEKINQMLSHVLEDIGWEDPAVVLQASPVIRDLTSKSSDFNEIIFQKVHALTLSEDWDLLSNFKSIISLTLKNSKLEEFKELEYFTNLKKIKLENVDNLKELRFYKENSQIEEVTIVRANKLLKIEGLNNLINLKEIDFNDLEALKEISFSKQNSQVEKVTLLSCKTISELTGLNYLTNLRRLDLMELDDLKEITLGKKNSQVNYLQLLSNKILSDVKGLHHLKNLQNADFALLEALKEISFSKQNSQLEKVFIESTGIEKISIPKRTRLDADSSNIEVTYVDDDL
jgi:hypothetical protein